MRLLRRHLWVIVVVISVSSLAMAQPPDVPFHERVEALLKQMREETTTPQEAWEDGNLTKETLFYMVGEESLLDNKRGLWQPGVETYQWTQLLIDQFPEVLENPQALKPAIQTRIAFLLLSKRDERGAAMIEKMLADMPRENADVQIVNALIYNLSNYYRSTGNNAKALTTSLSIQEFSNDPETLSNLLLGAARTTYAMGDKEGAKKIYQQIIGYGYGWTIGHAYNEMAGHLFAEGKTEEGRELLKKPIEGANADQIRVVLNYRLAQSYFDNGEWEEAGRYAQATIDQYNSLANPIKNHGLESYVSSAKELPRRIEQWKTKPIQFHPDKITLKVEGETEESIRTYFQVHSYRAITASTVSTDPDVKVWPLRSPYGHQSRNSQMIGVEITRAALNKNDLTAELIVTFREFPDVKVNVPIALQKSNLAQQ